MKQWMVCPLALVMAVSITAPAPSGVFSRSDDSSYDSFIVVHPPGYTGVGGELTVKICVSPGSQTTVLALRPVIDMWNALAPITGNCAVNCLLWEDPVAPVAPLSMATVLLHEMGHCAYGLGHINLGDSSFTNSRDSVSIDPGADGVRGSRDDYPSPLPGTRILHWFRTSDNDPLIIDGTVIDGNTFTRRLIDLPVGSTWPASGNRAVGELLGILDTQAVMYNVIEDGQIYSGLAADDVNTVKHGMSGLDSQTGTADDYTVRLALQSDCATADIEVDFDEYPDIVASCFASLAFIETIHYRVVDDPLLFSRIVIRVDSTEEWDILFYDGFETGDLSEWSSATP